MRREPVVNKILKMRWFRFPHCEPTIYMQAHYIVAFIYGVYMSQLMRYSTACGSYHNFLVRGLLLPRNILKQWLLVIIMKLPLEFYVCHHDFTNRYGISASQLITDAFCLCYYHNPVLYSFMIYYQSCNKSNTMGGTNGAVTAYPSGTAVFIRVL